MVIEIRTPALSEGAGDAHMGAIHIGVHEKARRNERVFDVETSKVTLEVTAPADGVVAEYLVSEGQTLAPDQLIAILTPESAPQPQNPDMAHREEKSENREASKEPGAYERHEQNRVARAERENRRSQRKSLWFFLASMAAAVIVYVSFTLST